MICPLCSASTGSRPARFRDGRLLAEVAVTGLAWLALGAPAAVATEVPLIERTIDGGFGGNHLITADVDGDGDIDVIAAGGGEVAWWDSDGGNPPLFTKRSLDTGLANSRFVDATDVDGDGDIDIVAAADDIRWWDNDGASPPSFTQQVIFDNNENAVASVFAADFDEDGDMDVASVSGSLGDVAWHENVNGDGSSWQRDILQGNFNAALWVHAADIDGDSDTDIVAVHTLGGENIKWWENPGGADARTPGNWTEVTIAGFDRANSVHAKDIDGDGDTDVVVSSRNCGGGSSCERVAWWENTAGDGSSWTQRLLDNSFSGAKAVYAADVNGDGDIDILAAGTGSKDVSWFENPGGADTSDPTKWTLRVVDGDFGTPEVVHTSDVDGDGDTDILSLKGNSLTWWDNDTIHRNAVYPFEHTIEGSFDGAGSVYSADMDGDGDTDILGAAADANDIAWWANPGGTDTANPLLWTRTTIDADCLIVNSVFAADVDGDGDIDVIAPCDLESDGVGEAAWWENDDGDGSTWTKRVLPGTHNMPSSVFAIDLDTDGDMDILGTMPLDNAVRWWRNNGNNNPNFNRRNVNVNMLSADSVTAADLDGDGDVDVLASGLITDASQDLSWFENTVGDATSFTRRNITNQFDGAEHVHVADVDGDGNLDVLAASGSEEEIAWWENDGGAPVDFDPKHTIDNSFDGASWVYTTDVDADGDLDILGAAEDDDEIAWWENPGGAATTDGTPWTKHTVDSSFGGAKAVHPVDVDDDGDVDILGAAGTDDDITWWENRGGQFGLPTNNTSGGFVQIAGLQEVLKVTATHNGRTGDNPVELVTFDLLLEENIGDPLSDSEANALIESLRVYRDDDGGAGAGSFQLAEDTEVANISTLSLIAGVQTVSFVDGDANVEVPFGTDRCYFVVVETATGSPISSFRIKHQTENTSTGEDDDFDIPLSLEFTSEMVAVVTVNGQPTADAGPDQMLVAPFGGTVKATLDGSGSSDPETDPLTYTWTGPFPEGSGTVVGVSLMVTLPAGLHVITLTVTDGKGGMGSDTVEIEVAEACPVSQVFADQTLSGTQTINASGSITLGENLIIDGDDIAVNAPVVSFLNNTQISGPFSVSNTPSCP